MYMPWEKRNSLQRRLQGGLEWLIVWMHQDAQKEHRAMRDIVAQVADDLAPTMPVWLIETSLDLKAFIAVWHRTLQVYRGFLLCSDQEGQTFLIDRQTGAYLQASATGLVLIDGVKQAMTFVDALWDCLNQVS
jgi:hypothetical protein